MMSGLWQDVHREAAYAVHIANTAARIVDTHVKPSTFLIKHDHGDEIKIWIMVCGTVSEWRVKSRTLSL